MVPGGGEGVSGVGRVAPPHGMLSKGEVRCLSADAVAAYVAGGPLVGAEVDPEVGGPLVPPAGAQITTLTSRHLTTSTKMPGRLPLL